jgi:hypothetical protein
MCTVQKKGVQSSPIEVSLAFSAKRRRRPLMIILEREV